MVVRLPNSFACLLFVVVNIFLEYVTEVIEPKNKKEIQCTWFLPFLQVSHLEFFYFFFFYFQLLSLYSYK